MTRDGEGEKEISSVSDATNLVSLLGLRVSGEVGTPI